MPALRFSIIVIALLHCCVAISDAQNRAVRESATDQAIQQKEKTPIVIGLGGWRKFQVDKVLKKHFDGKTKTLEGGGAIVFNSLEEASAYFKEDIVKKWAKKINFDQQMILVWSWSGSGGDHLEPYVSLVDPTKVMFYVKGGITKDLANHLHVYAVRKDIKVTRPGLYPQLRLPNNLK